MQHLRAVLRSLRGAGLTANPKKCAIGRVEVRYLGFHLGHGQVHRQIDKTAAIATCTRPKTKREMDVSDRGLGEVLSQEIEGEERPVLYISRKISKREAKYSTIEKESLAIRWSILTLRYSLLGREFTLCSDHALLQWLHRMKDTNVRITRWYLAPQPFKLKVIHRLGVQMAVADFLSRNGGGGAVGERIRRRTVNEWFGRKRSTPVSCFSNWRGEYKTPGEAEAVERERQTADWNRKELPGSVGYSVCTSVRIKVTIRVCKDYFLFIIKNWSAVHPTPCPLPFLLYKLTTEGYSTYMLPHVPKRAPKCTI
ncbi:uncharacterized protein LOC113043959 [Carassius auratus]|uniref:Uncharacterized protein LOC113043959 n=1 Tax=Carassius auratus TaxID=7957 RepID=A0A6P6JIA2_CARAU|nr:uncharacterized protein LOC113043959 [Carassius auratus]